MPTEPTIADSTRAALERVVRDPKAKPADIVKAAELLRAMNAAEGAADVLDLSDADLLRVARRGVPEEGGWGAKRGTRDGAAAPGPMLRSEDPSDGTREGPVRLLESPDGDPVAYAIDPLS